MLPISQRASSLMRDVGGHSENIRESISNPDFSHGCRQQAENTSSTDTRMTMNHNWSLWRPLLGVLAQTLRHKWQECTWRVWKRAAIFFVKSVLIYLLLVTSPSGPRCELQVNQHLGHFCLWVRHRNQSFRPVGPHVHWIQWQSDLSHCKFFSPLRRPICFPVKLQMRYWKIFVGTD